jgi:chitodextrinase
MHLHPSLRRALARTLSAVLAAGALAVAGQVATGAPAAAAPSVPYTWRNAEIVGGGFVPGIVFNPSEQNLIYARTDIGGAYRWNQTTQRWIPLLDWVGWDRWGWNGVLSLATDPVQTNRVYAAVGIYLNDWDPNNGAILRSTDRGNTWQATQLPFKVGGNMPGRGMGERLAVDPNRNSTLYFGAEAGQGLWRSTDSGVTWSRVTNFPNAGNYVQDPGDPNGYLTFNQGVVWVAFDRSTGTAGNTTQGIYVGVADLQNTVYRSTNGGATWERLAGQPTGFLAHQGEVAGGFLYVTTSDKGGPYDGGRGDVWKYQISSGTWTQISPVPSSDTNNNYFGYSGLSVDRQNPNTLMVTGYSSWYPDTFIWRSTDGGATWRSFYDYAWPNRTNHYALDITGAPWLTFAEQKSLPEQSPKLGWMTEALEIDPFNSNRMMFGTGATIYGTTNLTALNTGGTVNLRPMAQGLEETAVLELVSPPSGGAPLFSGLGDIGGFRHTNLNAVPALMYNQPYFGATTSIDYAETNPAWMVRVGRTDRTGSTTVAFSTDTGANWWQGTPPSGAAGGTVALNANASRIVWSPDGAGVHYSTSFGGSFSPSSGVPAGAKVEADRSNPNKFYAFSGGTFYVSTNGGQSFASTGATGLPGTANFKAMHGVEGDVWLAGETGIFRSTNSGASFTKLPNIASAVSIGFGRAAPGSTYMALYTMATIDGVRGVYRSDNAGASWVRINDDQHQYGNAGEAITGDPRVYGRVYLGTNGRGIVYADPVAGPIDTTPPSAPGTPTASNVTSSSASLSWTASTDNVGVVGYDVISASNAVVATSATNSVSVTGLSASTQYVLRVRARDAAGNVSTPSGSVTFTTTGSVDTTPPSTPGTPAASNVTSSSASLSWTASTDNVGVVGYNVYREQGATDPLLASPTTNSVALTGLTANTQHQVYVRARDAAGNLSAASNPVTFTTTGGGGGCAVAYMIGGQWPDGFGAGVRITNNGTTAINGWTLTWTFANGQVITSLWQAVHTQSGANVSVTNPSGYNTVIGANGGFVEFGFNGSWNNVTNAKPTSFTLNGSACTVA